MNLQSTLKGKNLLVVDDEPDLRTALIFDFKRRGCNIFEAANGAEAIEIVRNYPIDIVVSDIRMPGGDGVDLLKAIRDKSPDIPIVLLTTGYADFTESDAIALGALGLIEKPIDRKKMLHLLETSCAVVS